MPKMDGYTAARRIMEEHPTPIVVVTASSNIDDTATAMRVLEAGAITVVQKPQGPSHPNFGRDARELIRILRVAAEVKLVRRRPAPERQSAITEAASLPVTTRMPKLVLIGASTGGPAALKSLLDRLSADLPWPILVVQHISPGFLPSLCEWLNYSSALPVRVAEFGEKVQPGHVYLAPDLCHMEIDDSLCIRLLADSESGLLQPSVARLFASAARNVGADVVAILLSGMGSDGVDEMVQLRRLGALTLAQDPDSVVVNGMPGNAVKRGAVDRVLRPEQIAALLTKLAGSAKGKGD